MYPTLQQAELHARVQLGLETTAGAAVVAGAGGSAAGFGSWQHTPDHARDQ